MTLLPYSIPLIDVSAPSLVSREFSGSLCPLDARDLAVCTSSGSPATLGTDFAF